MSWCRSSLVAVLVLLPLGVAGAAAADLGNRLVPGGASMGLTETLRAAPPSQPGEARSPLLGSGGFSLGRLSGGSAASRLSLPFAGGTGLAVGGYAAYGFGDAFLSSSLRSDGHSVRAELSAAYAGGLLGAGSAATLSLGSVLGRPQGFSLNPLQPGTALMESGTAGGEELNLSLSLMHQVTPSLALGGVAQASRLSGDDKNQPGGELMLGAGLGLRF